MAACPKPAKAEKKRPKWLKRSMKPIKRSALKSSRKPIRQRNEKRIARKYAEYRKVIASDFHKELRYLAWRRSDGLCECDECIRLRVLSPADCRALGPACASAWEIIPIWFANSGRKLYQRFRSTDGELHHLSYVHFGDETLAELRHVRWVWKSCHQRIEAEHGTRRRFLKGGR